MYHATKILRIIYIYTQGHPCNISNNQQSNSVTTNQLAKLVSGESRGGGGLVPLPLEMLKV